MKNLLKSRKLKLISATFVAIFSLAAVFLGTYAWFSLNRLIDASGTEFDVGNPTGRLSKVTFHRMTSKVLGADDLATQFSFNKTPVGTFTYDWVEHEGTYTPVTQGDTSIVLDDYTMLNQEHPIMLLFEFSQDYDTSSDPINIAASAAATDFLGGRDPDTKDPTHPLSSVYETISGTNYYALSSIAKFYYKAFSDDNFDIFDGNSSTYDLDKTGTDVWTGDNKKFVMSEGERFVNVDNDLETSSFESDIDILNISSGNVKYVAVVIDYYIDAVEYIYSTFLGDKTLEETYDYELHFLCDWSMEVY